jgi:hypothetical protein
VGTWGTDLFADDEAGDIRDHYRELLEDGVEDGTATQLTRDKFKAYLEEPGAVAMVAFAVTQSKLGRLDPDVRDRAIAVLDAGADLEVWARENPKLLPKRRAALDKARAQLTGPQPARKRVRPPKRELSGLAAGDVLAFSLPRRTALLRVVRVRAHRLGEAPVLEELDFDGTEVPPREALERLGPRLEDPIVFKHPLAQDTRLFAFVAQDVDWQRAGFRKVEAIAPRAGDEEARLPDVGSSWAALAESYRRKSGKDTTHG